MATRKGLSPSHSTLVYGLTNKAKTLSAQFGESDKIRFLIGTKSLREENEVHLIDVSSEDKKEIKCLDIFSHKEEICHLSASPVDMTRFFTCYTSLDDLLNPRVKAGLWKMTDDSKLEKITELKGHQGDVRCVVWSEKKQGKEVFSLDENILRHWDLNSAEPVLAWFAGFGEGKPIAGCWSPIHDNLIITAANNMIRVWDLRQRAEAHSFVAHSPLVKDVDVNPNKDYHLVTGGDDYKIKFWDTRKTSIPLLSFESHYHWVTAVKYNPFHDQLVLSAGTDGRVNLWNVVTVSSKPINEDNLRTGKFAENHLIQTFEEHEDSVYSIAWSTNQWLAASLSYDGRVVINYVPSEYCDLTLY